MRFLRLFLRAWLLRCPDCGKGRLFRSFISMNEECSLCDYPFQREGGFYLGAIYFNYGLTALILAIAFPILTLSGTLSQNVALFVGLGFAIAFPLLFFRHARSLWLGMDEFIDPYQRPKRASSGTTDSSQDQDC